VSETASLEVKPDFCGQLLKGRYRVEQEIGRGSFDTVYLAVDEEAAGRRVAIKTPQPRFLQQEGFVERFQADIQGLVELEHPHLAGIKDLGLHEGVPFLVLQHFAGGSLKERLAAERRLLPNEISPWLPDVAKALDFLHKRGLLHRDVRPGTIHFDADGNAFLSDFGIVRTLAAMHLGLSAAGEAPGPFPYLPPEIGTSPTLGPASDQYALAVTVYEALSGRLPHQAPTSSMLMVRKATEPPEPLGRVATFVPKGAADAVMKALAMAPEKRFATCADFAQAFHSGLTEAPAEAPALDVMAWMVPRHATSEAAAVSAAAERALPAVIPRELPRPVVVIDMPGPLPRRRRPVRISVAWIVFVVALILLGGQSLGLFDPTRSDAVLLPGGVHLKLVWVPGGVFQMGCSPGDSACSRDEQPAHLVHVDGFWLGRYEVTQRQWKSVMGESPASFQNCGPDCPVENVSWQDAQRFLKKARHGLRLPTEAEWEYAVRAGGADLHYSDPVDIVGRYDAPGLDPYAWYGGNSGADYKGGNDCSDWPDVQYPSETCGTQPVGGKKPNLYGLYDMLGNVWEWCQDAYRDDVYMSRHGVTDSPVVNGDSASLRVLRGGSWSSEAQDVRPSGRLAFHSDSVRSDIGFRVARSSTPAAEWP
jgi:formylglycine-generating enzyme required for sulfatase activity